MDFEIHSFLNGSSVIESKPEISLLWSELSETLGSITDEQIISHFESAPRRAKSISNAINEIIDDKLVEKRWNRQSRIFKDIDTYTGTTWTLDFSKSVHNAKFGASGIAVEIVFNHGEAIAWNLIKLSLAAEKNYVRKETDIGEGIGVYVCATSDMKEKGGFDGAVGEYEKVLKYLDPLSAKLIRPLVIVGLKAPRTFKIEHFPDPMNKQRKVGKVKRL